MMKPRSRAKIFFRVVVALFWLGLALSILYFPKIISLWSAQRSINVFTWTDMIDGASLQDFEQKTGIKVNLTYFESNEELFVKLSATKGQGYDVIVPSDYVVSLLREEDLLQKLDYSKLTITDRINPRLRGLYYDPDNEYSIPYYWALYGLGVDRALFDDDVNINWDMVYQPVTFGKIATLNNPRESILLGADYLFNTIYDLDAAQIAQIKQLLITQKKWVEAYTDAQADFLLASKTCPIVISTTPLMWRAIKANESLDFVVPQDKAFSIIDTFVIPKTSDKQDLVYELLNYLFQPEVIEHHFNRFPFFPATIDLPRLLQQDPVNQNIIDAHTNPDVKMLFFENVIPEKIINDVWIALKGN